MLAEVNAVQETTELLTVQVDALIRRVAAKDDDFAKERRVWKTRVEKLERELRNLKREAKKGITHVVR